MAFENWHPSATLPRRPCVFFFPLCFFFFPNNKPAEYRNLATTVSSFVSKSNWHAHGVVISTPKHTLNLDPAPEPGQHSRILTRLRTGRSGVWIPSGEEIFLLSRMSRPALRTTRAPVQWVQEFFPRVKRPVRDAHHPPHLVRRLRMRRGIH